MKIERLHMEGIKLHAEHTRVDLGGLDLFLGPNGCGKSTVLEAVQVGMLGHLPGRGKRLEDTWGLYNPAAKGLTVQLGFGEGQNVAEVIEDIGGKLSESIHINGEEVATTEGKRLRREMLGDFPLMFDLGEFLGLSDPKKKDFLAGLVSEGLDADTLPGKVLIGVLEALKGVEALKAVMDALDCTAQEAATKMHDKLPESNKAVISEAIDTLAHLAKKSETPLEGLEKFHAEIKRKMLDSGKDAKARRAEIDGLVEPESYMDPQALGEKEAQLVDTETKLAAARKEHGAAENAAQTYQRRALKIQEVEDEIGVEVQILADLPEVSGEELEKALATIKILDDQHREKMAKHDELTLRSQAAGKTLAALEVGTLCPTCGQAVGDEVTGPLAAAVKKFDGQAGKLEEQIAVLVAEIDLQDTVIENADKRETAAASKVKLEAELEQLQAEVGDVPSLEMAGHAVEGLEAAVTSMRDEVEAARTAATKLEQRATAELAVTKIEERQKTEKAITEAARDLIHGSVKMGSAAIQAKVQELLSEITPGLRFVFDFEGKGGRLRFGLENGSFVPFAALSGGETVLVSCALATALILLKNPPCKVLMVEAAEVDGVNGNALLGGLAKMAAHLDNVLVASCHELTPDAADGWTVHELGDDEAARADSSQVGRDAA